MQKSGLSKSITNAVVGLGGLPPAVVLIISTLVASIATEFASNPAVAGVLLPIALDLVY